MQPAEPLAQRLGSPCSTAAATARAREAPSRMAGRHQPRTAPAACARRARWRRAARSRAPAPIAFRDRTALSVRGSMRPPSAARISSSETAAAATMRAFCALPCRSATTRNFSPASGSAASTIAPRPLDSTKRPRSPRAFATRSGQAWRSRAPAPMPPFSGAWSRNPGGAGVPAFATFCPALRANRSANCRAALARGDRSLAKRDSRRSRSLLSPPSPRSVISTASIAAVKRLAGRRGLG